ncbi:MAG: cyclic nucleotide-binding/CBS domain-containing protein [Nitrosopumilaceae archaeon]
MSTEKSLSEMLVKDIMTRALITVDPGTTVFQVAKMMEQGGIGAVLMKKDGNTSGIITDRDFAIKISTQKLSLDTPVEKIVSSPLETVNSAESIITAAKQMTSKKIRKLAVVEEGKIVGIITSTDLVNQLAK